MSREPIGARIKARRLELELSKAGLAHLVGVSDVSVGYWESGEILQVGHLNLVRLCQALRCSPAWLLGMEDMDHDD